ncbi:MAG: SUMF1/EgtB/PvdO family nonheme iron enzyme [Rubrivivax sp.]|nr:SUMF1/EgtB/PvdO family nonheme iron enzyme [Rubrivivax sp.]
MHAQSLTATAPVAAPALAARRGGAAELAWLLQAARRDTLATFAAWRAARPALQVPPRVELNPPLWELGHVGWFQSWWLARFPARALGLRADPDGPRLAPLRDGADALYDSGRVPHDRRWSLPLPDAETTLADLERGLAQTLDLLAALPADTGDEALYFFRLALLHEDMHHEAALYMAQSLGVPIADPRWQPQPLPDPPPPLRLPAGAWSLGSGSEAGFAFDNELHGQAVALDATEIDAQVLRWAEYLPFADDGGYDQPHWWSDAGWRWRQATARAAPRYLRRDGGDWLQWRAGAWQPLDRRLAACHLSAFEAEAWCRWAGRRLPTEAEWERAAFAQPQALRWGAVWEWTASPFAPYPGFRPHPYRDYSAPWFDGRPVLRGASFMTQPRLAHPRYRNYFPADRDDVPAGLRSCAR